MKERHFSFLKFFIFIILIISLIVAYGFLIEPKLIKVKEYKIAVKNLPNNFDGFKIVHITDIHFGKVFDIESLNKLVKSINEQEPDIVVLTGDLIDKDTKMTSELSSKISNSLSKIETKAGKYAITGNNDLNFDEWTNIISGANFINLNNSYDEIYKNGYESIFITGLSTEKDKLNVNEKLKTPIEYLNSFEKNGPIYKILLIHEPDTVDEITNNPFDLILAGHSHAGQVRLPLIGPVFLPDGAKKYHESHYKIENKDLYISNGLGVSNFNFRLFNTPSYNVYRLVKGSE